MKHTHDLYAILDWTVKNEYFREARYRKRPNEPNARDLYSEFPTDVWLPGESVEGVVRGE